MSIAWKELVKAATLTGAPISQYTCPGNTAATIQQATVNNPTGAPVQVNLYKVPSGLAADATTKIATRLVPAGAVVTLNEALNHKLQGGTQLFADGLATTLNISGVEYVAE